MRTSVWMLLLLFSTAAHAQNIKIYRKQVDSLVKAAETMTNLKKSVVKSAYPAKFRNQPEINILDIYFTDPTDNKLVKVEHNESQFYYDKETYYYFNNQVVLARTMRRQIDNISDEYLATGDYYFQNDKVVYVSEDDQKIVPPSVYMQKGLAFLKAENTTK